MHSSSPTRGGLFRSLRGFTLIEIVIGTLILSVVVGVSIPAIMGAREKSRKERMAANVKTLSDANWRLQISGEGNEVTKSGNDKQAALDYYLSRNVLADRGSSIELEGLVFSNGIWGTTNDPASHFVPPVTNPTPDNPTDPNPNQTFLDLLGPLKIDGQDVEQILGDLNGQTVEWVFTDPNTGETRTNKIGSWDPTTGASTAGGGVPPSSGGAGSPGSGGYFYGSGTVPSTVTTTNYNPDGSIAGVEDVQVWSGGPTTGQLGCETGFVQLNKVLLISADDPTPARQPGVVYGTVYGGGRYNIGSLAYGYAVPQSGFRFVRWRGSNGGYTITSQNPLIQIPVSGCEMVFRAEFVSEPPSGQDPVSPPPCGY